MLAGRKGALGGGRSPYVAKASLDVDRESGAPYTSALEKGARLLARGRHDSRRTGLMKAWKASELVERASAEVACAASALQKGGGLRGGGHDSRVAFVPYEAKASLLVERGRPAGASRLE